MRLLCVIPARFGSTRLPGKPLRLLRGEPLIRVVTRRALALDLAATVVVASDEQRVLDAVDGLGVETVLTDAGHASGTERVAEVTSRLRVGEADIVLNLQGDEPFLPPDAAAGAVARVRAGDDVGTAAQPLMGTAWRDPNRVKVELDGRGRAQRFYRTPAMPTCGLPAPTFHHLGVYAYRPSALRRWVALPPVADERAEGLEQLRPLAHGLRIGVAVLPEVAPHGIDTENDLRLAEAML
ncbi:MAG: 3-deoxy-manno-octulosonate cytidylyltransferase [Gemmatimonadota bacterium]|nr:3-deoxy-manno-octulosonate cytidylyltransferase [Gemmatimonadota bacterium]MDH5197018.1 3-deoxy-manno-octulosonate cytidylyltransferase [Gemmatimonadota bacterium]